MMTFDPGPTLAHFQHRVSEIVNEATGDAFDWDRLSDADWEAAWRSRRPPEDFAAELLGEPPDED
jgi:hypothetical protein